MGLAISPKYRIRPFISGKTFFCLLGFINLVLVSWLLECCYKEACMIASRIAKEDLCLGHGVSI